MSTASYDLDIEQNATFSLTFLWKTAATGSFLPAPVDLTGYTAALQIRAFPLSPTVLYDASSDITLGGTAGTIALTIPASTTSGFTWWNGVYDLLLTSSGGVATRLLSGSVNVSAGVST